MEQQRRSFPAGDDDGPARAEEVRLPPNAPEQVWREAIRGQRTFSLIGYAIGGIVIIAGIVIFVLGINESINLEIEGLGLSSKVQTSAAGVVIALIGLVVIVVSRFSIRTAGDGGADQGDGG
jgi:hypothetical protein